MFDPWLMLPVFWKLGPDLSLVRGYLPGIPSHRLPLVHLEVDRAALIESLHVLSTTTENVPQWCFRLCRSNNILDFLLSHVVCSISCDLYCWATRWKRAKDRKKTLGPARNFDFHQVSIHGNDGYFRFSQFSHFTRRPNWWNAFARPHIAMLFNLTAWKLSLRKRSFEEKKQLQSIVTALRKRRSHHSCCTHAN